jgi:L-amino acid N-acyltransferase YncA
MQDVRGVSLRAVSMVDAMLLLGWRNDPVTRRASRNTDPVSWNEHKAWLTRVLVSSDHVMRIAEVAGAPVGVVRAARSGDEWELSWTVAPDARGRGFGSIMLKTFVAELDGRLAAVIRKNNPASAKIASAAGLKCAGDAADTGYELWTRE